MRKLAIFGYTPREEVIINTVRRDMPQTEIALFAGIPNKALEERVELVLGTSNADIGFLKNWNADVTLIGPDTFSIKGIQEKLRAAGIEAVGADSSQIKIETDRSYLRSTFPDVKQHYPPHEIFHCFNDANIKACLRDFGKYVVKYSGVYHQLGGGAKLSGLHLRSEEEAIAFAEQSVRETGSVVIEQQVSGRDFSVNALIARDGSVFFFPENYCYKLRNDNNLGPNTSGTGSFAYSSRLPFMTEAQQRAARDICLEILARINYKQDIPLVSGLNFDFRLGDDGQIYLFEMNTRFAGAGTLSTALDLTANPLLDLFERALRGSLKGIELIPRADSSVGIFTYPVFFPNDPSSDVRVEIPKATAMPEGVNCYTGWVQVENETEHTREVVLQNSTTQLFQTVGDSLVDCRDRLYEILNDMPVDLKYRRDIGDLEVEFLQPGVANPRVLNDSPSMGFPMAQLGRPEINIGPDLHHGL